MKRILFSLSLVSLFVACQKEITNNNDPLLDNEISLRAPAPRIDICHYDADNETWHLITVNENAWPAHEIHGDIRLDDQDGDGYVPDNECDYGPMGDCNDDDPNISPEAEEQCDNGVDDNCDGNIDENCSEFCHPLEKEVIVNTGSESYTIYVYPYDNSFNTRWSYTTGFIGATDPWDGLSNSTTIIEEVGPGFYAASLCDQLLARSGCDWYLPSLGELRAIRNQLGPQGDGSIPGGIYWSSNESDANNAIAYNFGNGQGGALGKLFGAKCRCIRR